LTSFANSPDNPSNPVFLLKFGLADYEIKEYFPEEEEPNSLTYDWGVAAVTALEIRLFTINLTKNREDS
jgi:hypothetical protein